MGSKPVEQMLVEGRDAYSRGPSGAAKPGEIRPAIVLEGEQATAGVQV